MECIGNPCLCSCQWPQYFIDCDILEIQTPDGMITSSDDVTSGCVGFGLPFVDWKRPSNHSAIRNTTTTITSQFELNYRRKYLYRMN